MLTIDQNNPIANSISTFGTLVDSEAIFVITRNVFTAITVVYYLAWFLPRLKQHGLKAALWMWKIICGVRDRDTRNKASQASRALLHRRLTNDPLPFTVQILTVLRFAVVGAFFWRWWRIRQEHSVADIASIYEPYGSLILGIVGVAYLQFATSAMRATLNTPRPTENQTNLSRALSKTLTDRLFAFSICDIVFITICSMCVPGHTSQAHLAFIVPIMTAWLFRSEVKAIVLWLLISISVSGQWYWAFVLTHNTSGPTYLQTVLPQLVFWALLCALMIGMRTLRRSAEDRGAFFQSLAEAMPFEVFVKDPERRFVYANENVLRKLRRLPAARVVGLESIQGLTDHEIGVEKEKADSYAADDIKLINGTTPMIHEREPTYEFGSSGQIETIKVPVHGPEGKVRFIVGFSRDYLQDADHWFFLNVVSKDRPHCFFHKEGQVFHWVNEQFANDVGKCTADIIGKSDDDLYTKECAAQYRNDDRMVLQHGALEREEWHQPIGAERRRVRVVKHRIDSRYPNKEILGVRGYFCSIHREYIGFLCSEFLLSNTMGRLIKHLQKQGSPEEILARRAIVGVIELTAEATRLLRISDFDIEQIRSRNLDDIPESLLHFKSDFEGVNPTDLVRICVYSMEFLYPNMKFLLENWADANKPIIPSELVRVACFGLLIHVAERARASEHRGKITTRFYLERHLDKNDASDSADILFLVFEINDMIDDASCLAFDIEVLSERVVSASGRELVGLQLALRASTLFNGRIEHFRRTDVATGLCTRLYIPTDGTSKIKNHSRKLAAFTSSGGEVNSGRLLTDSVSVYLPEDTALDAANKIIQASKALAFEMGYSIPEPRTEPIFRHRN